MMRDEMQDQMLTKEGRDLLRICNDLVAGSRFESLVYPELKDNEVEAAKKRMNEAMDAAELYTGSIGQMIHKENKYWETHEPKPKQTQEDWDALNRHLAIKKKKLERVRDGVFNNPSVEAIAQALGGKVRNDRAMVKCPAHEDKAPSLSVAERNGKLLLHCFAGCKFESIIASMKSLGIII